MKNYTYFTPTPATLEELKKMYARLAKKHHPDVGGKTEDMQRINGEYEELFKLLKNKHDRKSGAPDQPEKESTETPEEFRAIIEKIIFLDGIEIEICGVWVWVTGNTYPVKDSLKAAGFRFSHNKSAWYWHRPEDLAKHSKKKFTMDEIREMHGSQVITGEEKRAYLK